jgi:hypothetical protein
MTKLQNCLLTNPTDKNWWKLAKSVCGFTTENGVPALKVDDLSIRNPVEKANILNAHFANIFTVDETNIPTPEEVIPANKDYLNAILITEEEILDQLSTLDTSKATGPDEISPHMLKQNKLQLIKPLHILFNRSIRESNFPLLWKKANITPIFKEGDRHDYTNNRPICHTYHTLYINTWYLSCLYAI